MAKKKIENDPAFAQWVNYFTGWDAHLLRWTPAPLYRFTINQLTRALYQPEYIGFDKLPKEGPAMIIANHVSYLDGLIIDAGCNRPVRYVIDEDIYQWPVVHYFMEYNRAIPIAPRRDSVEAALAEISKGLKNGEVFCIFPEGQLTYTGSLGRFRPGIEWMIKRDPVPVYPVALKGLWGSVLSRKYRKAKNRWVPRQFGSQITAIMGDPIPAKDVTVNRLQQEVLKLKYLLS